MAEFYTLKLHRQSPAHHGWQYVAAFFCNFRVTSFRTEDEIYLMLGTPHSRNLSTCTLLFWSPRSRWQCFWQHYLFLIDGEFSPYTSTSGGWSSSRVYTVNIKSIFSSWLPLGHEIVNEHVADWTQTQPTCWGFAAMTDAHYILVCYFQKAAASVVQFTVWCHLEKEESFTLLHRTIHGETNGMVQ